MKYLFKNGTVVSGRGTRRADVLVEDVSFSSSLLTLSYRLNHLNQKKEERELSSESSPNGSHGIG